MIISLMFYRMYIFKWGNPGSFHFVLLGLLNMFQTRLKHKLSDKNNSFNEQQLRQDECYKYSKCKATLLYHETNVISR